MTNIDMPKRILIKEYRAKDKDRVVDCIKALQNHERVLEKDRVRGEVIAKKYLGQLLTKCRKNHGKIYVAVLKNKIIGMASVWIEKETHDITSDIKRYAYFSDLFVSSDYRRRGIGKNFFRKIQQYAKANKARFIKCEALSKNKPMRHLMEQDGFREYEIGYLKKL